jgi:hypothetical protein
MDRDLNDNANKLFSIAKFSAILIALFQGKIIFDLRSENFKLNESLTQSKAAAAQSTVSAAKIEDDNLIEIEKVFTLPKISTIFPQEQDIYSSKYDRINSIKQKIELLQNTRNQNLALTQKIKRLTETNKYLTKKLTKSKSTSSAEQPTSNATVRKRLLTTNRFWSLVMGKTRSQVTRAMGEPDEIQDSDNIDEFTSSWVYKNRIKHPGSSHSEKGSDATISFDINVANSISFD